MKSITIHGIDDLTVSQLEKISQEKGLSLNKTVKMLLHEILGIKPSDVISRRSDFEEFSGMWTAEEAEEFSASIKSLSEIEPGRMELKKVIVDTNAYTALMAGSEEILNSLGQADEVLIPIFVLGGLLFGFKNGSREKENRAILLRFLKKSTVKIIHTTMDTAEIFGRIKADLKKQGTPIPVNDVWIASQAIEFGAFLLTYDAHFKNIPGLLLYL